jgi:hypothetical protein
MCSTSWPISAGTAVHGSSSGICTAQPRTAGLVGEAARLPRGEVPGLH